MANYTTAKSGQPYKSNSGIILKVSSANAPVGNLTEVTNNGVQKNYGSLLSFPVSPNSSGNIGVQKSLVNGSAGIRTKYVEAKGFIAMGLPTKIAGTQSNILQGASPDIGIRMPSYKFYAYQRLHITSWNAQTGAATKGASNGVSVLASGLNGVVGRNADQAYGQPGIPGEFVMITGPVNPVQLDQPASTNP